MEMGFCAAHRKGNSSLLSAFSKAGARTPLCPGKGFILRMSIDPHAKNWSNIYCDIGQQRHLTDKWKGLAKQCLKSRCWALVNSDLLKYQQNHWEMFKEKKTFLFVCFVSLLLCWEADRGFLNKPFPLLAATESVQEISWILRHMGRQQIHLFNLEINF